MAKTSKNKTKLWRKQAREFNLQEGKTHQGRKNKNHWNVLPSQMPALMQTLLLKGGYFPQPVFINEALTETEGVVTNEAK